MRAGWASALAVVCAWGGVVLWAVGLAVLQPGTEPTKPWHEVWASNNSYWARDIRWMAIAVVLGGLILAFRGDRLRSRLSVLAMTGWLAADVWLDRADVAGRSAAVWLAVVACALVLLGALAGQARPGRPSRGVLIVTASVTAALVPVAGLTESPTDTEPGLTPAALAVGCLLALITAGCAISAAPTRDVARIVAASTLAVGAVGGLVLQRSLPPGPRFLPSMVLGAALLAGVLLTARARPLGRQGPFGYAALGVGTLVGYPVALMASLVLTAFVVPVAAPLTALAGNPPVNDADTDALYTLAGLLAGLAFGALFARADGSPPTPAPARPAAVR